MILALDTNVVASALVSRGVPYRFIEAAALGTVELVKAPALMVELRDVLGREHLPCLSHTPVYAPALAANRLHS